MMLANATEYCAYCPKLCRPACPVSHADGREAVIPQQKMATLGEMARGLRPWEPEFASVLWACTGCLRCRTWCAHGIEVGPALEAGRAVARARGAAPASLHDFAGRFHARIAADAGRLVGRHHARMASRAELALLPGCDALDLVEPALAALAAAGMHAVVANAMPSAGEALLGAGETEAFLDHARRLCAALSGYRRVVTSCPGCAHALRVRIPALGLAPPPVWHVAEALAPHAARLAPARRAARVAYLDACHLGRHLGAHDEPRALVRAAGDLVEFPHAREDGACAGGGALLPITAPDTARRIAAERLAEARDLGIDCIATACPTSRRLLRRVATDGVAVLDIVELIATPAREEPP